MEAFNSEVLLVRSSSERRKITKNAVDEIAGGGQRVNMAPYITINFPSKYWECAERYKSLEA